MERGHDMTQPGRLRAATLCLIVVVGWPLANGDAGAAEWTIDDIVLAERASGWTIDAEGRMAAWVRSSITKVEGEEKPVSSLWLSPLDGSSEPVQLTRGAHRDSQPRFSPDGRHLAFFSNRDLPPGGGSSKAPEDARPQVWLLPLGGGEPWPVTRFDRPVRSFDWISNDALVVLAQESPTARETRLDDEEKDTTRVIDDAEHEPPVRLFRVGLDGATRRLSTNDDWISALAVAPDGRRAVVSAQQSLTWGFDSKVPPHVYLVDLESGERTRLFEDGVLIPGAVSWTPSSSGFFFSNRFSRHPLYRTASIGELWEYDLERGTAVKVVGWESDWERGLDGGFVATEKGVLTTLANGVRPHPALYVKNGDGFERRDLEGTHVGNLGRFAASRDGRVVIYGTSAVNKPWEWYVARLEDAALSEERRLVAPNEKRYESKPTGQYEVVRWTGARDEEVEGLLHYPLDWKSEGDGARPLILDIHGGPLGADRDSWGQSWASPNILWLQRGAFVLQVNYHGSSSYGLDWAESIEKKYYDLEIPDIEAGVDHLIERGLVDPEQLASSGWSNGGILTVGLITQTRRYKAAVVGAADVEWISDWGNVTFGASFDNYYFGTTPWEDPQTYIDKSPFFRLTEVTTPTIIHTGTEDVNVPPHQSWSLFRAMQFIDKTPARLLIYPGEPHSLRKLAHQRRKIAEDLAWFDEHFFKNLERDSEAIKEGSPLDSLLQLSGALRSGRAFGQTEGGVLVPETVTFEGLEVGRFEVTRAQWSAFDDGFELTPGEENLPVVGVGFERARAYAAWLAERTGRSFRLPTREEAEKLAKAAGSGGNTLDRWAGYTPNPEDAAGLAVALEPLPEGALLMAAGSLAGKGDDPVFDLDGNAAEWAVDDGGAAAVGASAERSSDPRSRVEPSPAYTGLRVVIGE